MKEKFGQYIRKLRTDNNYTLTQLAAKLGVDSGALSKIETGKRQLNEKLLSRLAEVFDLNEMDVRNEYYADLIATILLERNCSDEVITLATKKVIYRRNKGISQGKIGFAN